ncbi:VCBS repeat-containing protein [Aegicerativicinus sediminis]|uniref:VCBS repeat-containing protein n=1 Tax=Aegicerativicinus sediminis TaxID=2893202 RepID=UPI001E31EACF|nr:VCBS repeat-containing protein [Aegicerativicinus sediminis]
MRKTHYILFFYLILIVGCDGDRNKIGESDENALFEVMTPEHTGVEFTNEVIETENLNVMKYEYMYNGSGVGIGDFNGDGLADIYLTGNTVKNKLFLNNGNFKFQDVTEIARVGGRKGWKTGVSVADVNGDGLLDIYVCYSGLGTDAERANQLFVNQGNNNEGLPVFKDEAELYGIDAAGTYSTQAAFFDYDLDGDLDMFLLNHSKNYYSPFYNSTKLRNTRHPLFGNSLFRNDDGKFKNVSQEAGIHGSGLNFGLGVAISDFNEDNLPDIYVSNDYVEQDFLYLNNGDGTFKDASKMAFDHISQFSMGNDAADINNDGHIDLITLDMLPEDNYRQKVLKGPDEYDRYQLAIDSGYHKQQMRNMFQLNMGVDPKGNPRYSEIGQLTGISNTDWSWAPLLADFDGDGKKDLYITNGYLRDYTNKDFMKFEVNNAMEKASNQGVELFGEEGKEKYSKVIFDLVNLMPSTKVSNYMLKNTDGLSFENVTKKWGLNQPTVSTGAAYADLDNDGDLDLIVSNTNDPVGIYRNNLNEKSPANYIKIKLEGDSKNTFGIGAKVWVVSDSLYQFAENYPIRGYQSSVDPELYFGLGNSNNVTIKVQWPDGKVFIQNNVPINRVHQISQSSSGNIESSDIAHGTENKIFEEITNSGINYKHHENRFVDFKFNRLALFQNSRSGSKMSVADVNGDGIDDVFIGGALGQTDGLYISQANGKYLKSTDDCWNYGISFETIGSAFLDVDNDGDQDLYVVNGGSEPSLEPARLKDKLFINLGNGKFVHAPDDALPQAFSNGSVAVAGDFDNDGDQDLYVGGGDKPGNYPEGDLGGILRNDTNPSTGEIRFTIVTKEVNPDLRQPGLITDAKWVDLNNDKWLDLVLVGEWMPIRIFINQSGKLVEKSRDFGLENTTGLWQSLGFEDIDGDGDQDLIVGNMGSNLQFKATKSEPMEAFVGDFRDDGLMTTVISCYIQGERYPIATLDELQDAFPLIKKKFLKYDDYAKSTLDEVFSDEKLNSAQHFEVQQLQSLYLENTGQGFKLHVLPTEAQFSAIQGINIYDFDGDNNLDVLLTGNYYPMKVEYGPVDAGKGLLLKGNGNGQFSIIKNDKLGLWIDGDVRDSKLLHHNDDIYIILSKNNDSTELIRLKV